ncbi:MAG: hypothetical protein ACYDCC_16225 [Actinomycetota bacterium]
MASSDPNWVRPVYLHIVSLFGVVLMAFGAIGLLLGIVHIGDPKLKQQSDPFMRIAQAVVNVVEKSAPAGNPTADQVVAGLANVKSELNSQARQSATNDVVRSVIVFLVGASVYKFHERKIGGAQASQTPTAT